MWGRSHLRVTIVIAAALLLAASSSLISPVAAATPTNPKDPTEGLCARVTELLGVPSTGSGVVNALTLVFRDTADKSGADAAAMAFDRFDEFAQKLLAGSEPSLVEKRVLDFIDVASGEKAEQPPAWHFGSHGQRILTHRIWQEAKRVQSSDPNRAARLGKAAILLQVQDLFGGGPGLLREPVCASLVGVDQKQVDALLADYAMPYRDAHAQFERVAAIVQPLERCMAGAAGKPQDDYRKDAAAVVRAFRDGWPELPTRRDHWQFAHLLWQFVCLSRDRHDEASLDQAQAVVNELAPQTADPHDKRWLEQALTMPGERPKTTGIKILTDPNQMKPPR